jgi:Undecaprenyl-phosphate glucose phosphotransferase
VLKEHSRLLLFALAVADLAATGLAWSLVALSTDRPHAVLGLLPVVLALALVSNLLHRLYRPRRRERFVEEFVELLRSSVAAWLGLAAVLYLARVPALGWRAMVGFLALNTILVVIERRAARLFLRLIRRKGYNTKSVAVVGTGPMAKELLDSFARNPWYGFVVEYLVAETPERVGRSLWNLPIAADLSRLTDTLQQHPVEYVYLALSSDMQCEAPGLVESLADVPVEIRHVPDLARYVGFGVEVGEIDGLPIMALLSTPLRGWRRTVKNMLDRLAAAVALVILGLPMLIVAGLIRLTGPGPALFGQERIGLDGRGFRMLKFRTYPPTAPDDDRPRAPTRIGALLRRYSLDELPQLINVIRGEMSLVGPRPETPDWMANYRAKLPRYMLRHRVKSGMTGWAQVHGLRGDTSIERRLQYDLYYVSHWSFLLDAQILMMTLAGGFIDRAEPRTSDHSP